MLNIIFILSLSKFATQAKKIRNADKSGHKFKSQTAPKHQQREEIKNLASHQLIANSNLAARVLYDIQVEQVKQISVAHPDSKVPKL